MPSIDVLMASMHDVQHRKSRVSILVDEVTASISTGVPQAAAAIRKGGGRHVLTIQELSKKLTSLVFEPLSADGTQSRVDIRDKLIAQLSKLSSDRKETTKLTDVDPNQLTVLISLLQKAFAMIKQTSDEQLHQYGIELGQQLKERNVDTGGAAQELLSRELQRLFVEEPSMHTFLLPQQQFSSRGGQNALTTVLAKKPLLCILDLGQCLISDDFFRDNLLEVLSSMQHLRFVALDENLLSTVSVKPLIGTLENASLFPSLKKISLAGNEISPEEMKTIEESLLKHRFCTYDSLSGAEANVCKALNFNGSSMNAATIATSLLMGDVTLSELKEGYDIFCGSSFASIVAAAVVLGDTVTVQDLHQFFLTVAENIFFRGHYTYYVEAATRSAREWWTGGDYYHSNSFRESLETLFGDKAAMPLNEVEELTGKRLLFSILNEATGEVEVIRSWNPFTKSPVTHLPVTLSLVDALCVCCSTPGMFAKQSVGSVTGRDAMFSSLLLCLSDASRLARGWPLLLCNVEATATSHAGSYNPIVQFEVAAASAAVPRTQRALAPYVIEIDNATQRGVVERLKDGLGLPMFYESFSCIAENRQGVAMLERDECSLELLSAILPECVDKSVGGKLVKTSIRASTVQLERLQQQKNF